MKIIKGPYLMTAEKDSMTIVWETDCAASSEVRVFDAVCPRVPRKETQECGEPRIYYGEDGDMHRVRVDGLNAGTDYCYEVYSEADGENATSRKFMMHTAPEEKDAFSFALICELGGSGGEDAMVPTTAPMLDKIRRERPDFLMSVGDLVGDGTDYRTWDGFFHCFSKMMATTPIYPCVGNHEVGSSAAAAPEEKWRYDNYKKYFGYKPYYSFDYGCAHFVILDSPDMIEKNLVTETDSYLPAERKDFLESEQIRFLEKDLAASNARWKFVVFHYPPYTSALFDHRELRELLAPIFEKYDVDVVFNSHSILYERSHPIKENEVHPDGVRYVVVGGFKDVDQWFRPKANRFSAKISARPCFTRVSLTPWRLELQAIDYEGILFDSLTIEKGI